MIIEAEIISLPYSGQYNERIYDNENVWNSQNWTFIKFTTDKYSEWCGHFRGLPKQVSISTVYNLILVLTSDYLFQLDKKTGNLLELEYKSQYQNLTIAPNGSFILADYYNLEKLTTSIKQVDKIVSPIEMDMIEFKNWDNNNLSFTCEELLNWGNTRHLNMIYDSETNKIIIRNAT